MRFHMPALLLLTLTSAAIADTVSLNNGDKITGTILEVTPSAVTVQTPYAGKVTIDLPAVQTMQSEKAVAVTAASGEKQQLFVSPTADGKSWQKTAAFVPPTPPPPPAAAITRHTSYLDLGPGWKNQLAIGVSNTAGNDETTTFAGSLAFHYTKKPDEFTLKFEGDYGMSNGRQNAGLFSETAVYRHDLADRLFGYIDDDARYDAIKGISIQATSTVGLGYKLVDDDKFKIDVRGGPGITYTRTFDDKSNTAAAAEAGFRLQYVFNERTNLSHEDTYTTSLCDFNVWRVHSETALNYKLDLESGLGLKLGFNDDYENRPAFGRKNNDTRLMLSLTLDF